MFQTEFQFTLPCGYQDEAGLLHREVTMRRATAADEILPLKDPRVQANPAYLVVILLARVVTRLGSVTPITPKVIENLYATDLAFLQEKYNEINQLLPAAMEATCPNCHEHFAVEQPVPGGS